MNRAPYVHGYLYDLFDRPVRIPVTRSDRVRLAVERLNLRRFVHFLRAGPWDLVINTHFLPAEIVGPSLRRQGKIDVPQVTVTTDFDTHRMVVSSTVRTLFHGHRGRVALPAILRGSGLGHIGDGRADSPGFPPAEGQIGG